MIRKHENSLGLPAEVGLVLEERCPQPTGSSLEGREGDKLAFWTIPSVGEAGREKRTLAHCWQVYKWSSHSRSSTVVFT